MTNLEKYDRAFITVLGVSRDELGEDLVYMRHDNWDSVSHMDLVVELEGKFDISMQTIDVTSMNTYERGKQILSEKYGVDFTA